MGFWRVLGFDGSISTREGCVGWCVCEVKEWLRSRIRTIKKELPWMFFLCVTHEFSFVCDFHRQNNRSSNAGCKIMREDAGFWMQDSSIRCRCRIGLEHVWTSEIDVEQKIEGCDCLKAVTCAICSFHETVLNIREWYTSREIDASKWPAISSMAQSEMRSVVAASWWSRWSW